MSPVEQLLDDFPQDTQEQRPPAAPGPGAGFAVEPWMARHGLTIRRMKPWNGGQAWELETCPFNHEHSGGCAIITQGAGGALGFKCHHNGCAGNGWRDLRAHLDGPREQRRKTEHGSNDSAPEPEIVAADKVPDFPEAAWRGIFADYRGAMAKTTEASDVYHFETLWAGSAVSLGRRVWMFSGERTYANVYLSLFGGTGDKKTTAQRQILNYGLLPPSIQIIRNLGSTEGLADCLKREDGGDAIALCFWEELTALLARGRWSGSTILEFITECFDCPPQWGLKYRKEPITITAPTPTILAGTTPEWFWKNARGDDFYGGFGNRFLYLTGRKKAPIPNPEEPDGAAMQKVRDALHRLQTLRPMQARFCPTAGRVWEKFYTDWEQTERTGLYSAAVKRVHVYVRKLAMAYAALEGTLPNITVEQLKAAITVGLYAAECARLLVDAQNAAVRPEREIEQKFLEWVKKHEGQRKRYMQQTLNKVAGSCKVFNEVFQNLIRADQIEVDDGRVYLPR